MGLPYTDVLVKNTLPVVSDKPSKEGVTHVNSIQFQNVTIRKRKHKKMSPPEIPMVSKRMGSQYNQYVPFSSRRYYVSLVFYPLRVSHAQNHVDYCFYIY